MTTLVDVAPGKQLAPAPAASYARVLAAGCPAGITSAYRSPERQAELRADYLANPTTVAYAAPVELSEHVDGYALDLPAGGPREWFAAHGNEHGWIRTDPREAWHYAYRLVHDRHLIDLDPPPAPLPIELEDPLVRLIRIVEDGRIFLVGPTLYQRVPTMARANALAKLYGSWEDVTAAEGQQIEYQVVDNITATASNMKGQGLT